MAISSPISLLKSTASQTTKTTKSIQNTLTGGLSRKRNLISSIGLFKNRRREVDKREIQKNIISNPTILTKSGGARSLSLSDQGLNITDRLFGFVKYLTAGWILGNLPTWISLGEQFAGRLGTAGSILKNYGDETFNVMKSISGIFDSAFKNLSAFDFSDSSGLMENSIGELTKSLDDLGKGLSSSLDVLFAPFKDVPEIGKITEDPDAYTDPPQQPSQQSPQQSPINGKNSDFWTLVAITSLEESDPQGRADVAQSIYNRSAAGVFPGGKNIRNIILAGNGGQYQPVERAVKEFHQIGDRESAIKAIMVADKVSRKTAEQMIDNTASAINNPTLRKNAAEFIENRTDFRGKNLKVDKPSSTLPRRRTPNDNIFGNFVGPASYTYGQKTSGKPSPVPNFGVTQTPPPQQSPNQTAPTRPSGQRRLQTKDVFTKSLGKGVDYIEITSLVGDPRKHGVHRGIDIGAPQGTYIALRVDCEVVFAGNVGAYGNVMDVWISELGVQLRLAHLSAFLIRSGKIKAGTSFARVGKTGGTSTGPHIHLEYDTKKGASRGGGFYNDDPQNYIINLDQYVRLLLLSKNPNNGKFSPANTPTAPSPNPPKPSTSLVPSIQQSSASDNPEQSVEMQNNNYTMNFLQGIVQERKGQKIVIIDDRGSTITQQVISSSSGGDIQIKIPDFVLLNTFMKNKLLLDLTYL
jgi:murein DD-endopeptidase MepM/ murein hydrolase activator NlpD